MNWDDLGHQIERSPGRALLVFVLAVILLSGIGFGLRMLLLPAQTAVEIAEKTLDADNVIYNYEWFKKQFRAVQAIDHKIEAAKTDVEGFKDEAGPRSDWTFEDKTELARLRSIATGLEMQRADMVADYNAKANMVNRQIFMGSDCPDHIN